MLLNEDLVSVKYSIKEVKLNSVLVNELEYTESMIIMPNKLIVPWSVVSFDCLKEEDFSFLFSEKIRLMLIGVGQSGRKLPHALYYYLLQRGVSLEVMSLASAARTYAILSAEGRSVALGLLFES